MVCARSRARVAEAKKLTKTARKLSSIMTGVPLPAEGLPPPQVDGKALKRTASGSMAVFSSGEPGAALTKGGGDPM